MKKIVLCILIMLFLTGSQAYATISKVQEATNTHPYNSPATSISCTLSSGATSGNLLVTCIATDKNAGTYTVPTGFTLINYYTGPSVSGAMAYKISTGGETTITWSYTNSEESSAWVGEYSGLASSNVLDASAQANSADANVTSQTTGTTGTTTVPDELAIAMFGIDSASNATGRSWSDSFVEQAFVGASFTAGLGVAQKILSSIGVQKSTASWATADQACAAIATFKTSAQTFQDGVYPTSSYSGTSDTHIRSDNQTTNYGTTSPSLVDGDAPDSSYIIKWDISSLPQDITVTAVTITLNVTNATVDTYEIYEMKRNWIEGNGTSGSGADWNTYNGSTSWTEAGAQSTTTDRGSTVLGTITSGATGLKTIQLNSDGVALVQAWIDGTKNNYGFIFQDYTAATDGIQGDSREAATATNRPKLTVSYTTIPDETNVSAYTGGTPTVPPSTVNKGTTSNCLGTFKFAGSGTISQITITEYGTCDATNDLENVKLFQDDGDGNWELSQDTTQLGSTTTFSGASSTATFSGFSLNAGATTYVHVVLDVKDTATITETIGIEISTSTNVTSTKTVTASSWPVQLGTSTISPAAATILIYCDARPGNAGDGMAQLTVDFNQADNQMESGWALTAVQNIGDVDPITATGGSQNVDGAYDASELKTVYDLPHFFAVGNHEAETAQDMTDIRAKYSGYPAWNLQAGPTGCSTTTYSYDVGDIHVVVINEYWDGASNDAYFKYGGGEGAYIHDNLFSWLKSNLRASTKPYKIVIGHEPGYPVVNHIGNSLDEDTNNRDKFFNLLRTERVIAYWTGHDHHYHLAEHDGVFEADAGVTGCMVGGGNDNFATLGYAYYDSSGFKIRMAREDPTAGWSSPWVTSVTRSDLKTQVLVNTAEGAGTKCSYFIDYTATDESNPNWSGNNSSKWWENAFSTTTANWSSGELSVGYDTTLAWPWMNTTINNKNGVYGAFIRVPFTCYDKSSYSGMKLQVDYDDAVTVWLNGTKIYEAANSPDVESTPNDIWDKTASSAHTADGDGDLNPDYTNGTFDVSSYMSEHLYEGSNIVAIGNWNNATTSTDLAAGIKLYLTTEVTTTTVSGYHNGTPTVPPSVVDKPSTSNCLGTFKFAGSGTISKITITEYGTCNATSDLENVKLFQDDGDGNWELGYDTTQLGSTTTFSGSSSTATFSGFSLTAGAATYVHVVLDVKSSATTSDTIGIQISTSTDIVSSASVVKADSWPVQLGTSNIGPVTIVSNYTGGSPTVPPSSVVTSSTGNCLGTFKFAGQGTISQITLTEYGTCDADSDLENVKLFQDDGDGNWESAQDTTQLGSTTTFSGSSSTATFSGLSLTAGSTCYVHVVLDVKSSAPDGQTIGIELYQDDIVCTSTTTVTSWPVQLGESCINWWGSSWLYRKELTFDNSSQSENLIDFPVKVKLTSSNFDFSLAKSNGEDIRFVDSDDNTQLKYEIEKWDSSAKEAIIWVKVPQINGSSNTDFIYMYYGNSSAYDNQSATNVWTNGYVAVYHFAEQSGYYQDSTSNNNDANTQKVSSRNNTDSNGLGYYPEFVKSSGDYVGVPDANSLDFGTGDFTVMVRAKSSTTQTDTDLVRKGSTGVAENSWWKLEWGEPSYTNGVHWLIRVNGIDKEIPHYTFSPDGNWHDIWGTRDTTNTKIELFIDGTSISTATADNGSVSNSANIGIGSKDTYDDDHYDGYLDEVRLASVLRSDDWIAAQYKSMTDTFINVGSEQGANTVVSKYTGGTPTVPPSTVNTGTTGNCLGTFKFSGSGTISQISLTEYGTCDATSDLENVKLFQDDGDGNWESAQDTTQLGSTTTFSGASSTATFSGLTLPAGATTYVHVVLDVKSTATQNNTIGIEILQSSDVSSTKEVDASSWPVQLGTSTITIPQITVSNYTGGSPTVPPSSVVTSSTGNCLGTFKFAGEGTISQITLTEYGTCDADSDLENVKIFQDDGDGNWEASGDTTQLGSTTTFNASNKATFSSLSLTAGSTCYVHVVLDVKSNATDGQTIGVELYQDDIVCTSTTTATSWPVQLGESTINWWGSSWLYRKELTFDNSSQSENLIDFPVKVKLTSSNFDFSLAKSNGEDIRFVDSDDNTQLKYEIEKWDSSAKEAIIWVKVPQINGSSNTDFIYMYYGNSSASDAQDVSGVWTNNYEAVYHFKETSGNYLDSTNNNHDSDAVSVTSRNVTKFGNCPSFDGSDDYITVPDSNGFDIVNWTITGWINMTEAGIAANTGSGGDYYYPILTKGMAETETDAADITFFTGIDSDYSKMGADFENDTGSVNNPVPATPASEGTAISTGTWYFYTAKVDTTGNNFKIFRNGTQDSSRSITDQPNQGNTVKVTIGAASQTTGLPAPATRGAFKGYIDELRVSKVTRTDNWIAAQYKSMTDTFINVGNEEALNTVVSNYTSGTPIVPPAEVTKGTTGNCLGTFHFGGEGTISQITLTKYGTCDAPNDLENLKLFKDDGDGNWEPSQDTTQLGSTTTFSGASSTATFSGFNLTAGATTYVHVILDVKSTATENTTIGIEILQASDVSSTEEVTGISWPVQLGTSTIKPPQVTVSKYTGGTPTVPPAKISPPSTHTCLGTFKFEGIGTISQIVITEYGTCDADNDLENVKLFEDDGDGNWESTQDTTQLGSTTTFNASNKATFSGLSLTAGSTCYVHVALDVKSNATNGQTIGIELYQNDIVCTSTTTASSWPVQLGESTINWWSTSWLYRKKLTFDNSSQSENLTDFPVMVKLTSSNFDFSLAKSNGEDIRFVDSDDNTQLKYEIEKWDSSAKEAIIWIKVPQINGSSNTDFIYMYYGNSSASDAQDASGVWTNNYKAIYHFAETSGNYLDSTTNQNDLTTVTVTSRTSGGKFGNGPQFNGSTDKCITTKNLPITGDYTVEAWANLNAWANYKAICDHSWEAETEVANRTYSLWVNSSGKLYQYWEYGAGTNEAAVVSSGANTVTTGTWTYVAMARNTTAKHVDYYFNGSLDSSPAYTNNPTGGTSGLLYVGCRDNSSNLWANYIDELRISNTERSADWIAAQYKSMTDTFINVGQEETPNTVVSKHTGGTPTVPPSTVDTGTTDNCVGTFKFAGSGIISQITITEYGTCAAANDLENVKLFKDDGDGNWELGYDTTQLGSTTTFSGVSSTATFSGFSLVACSTCYAHVVLDVKSTASHNDTVGIEILQASYVTSTNYVSASSWPVQLSTSTIKDAISPQVVTTLSALTGQNQGQIKLSWTAPGDDGWNNDFDSGSQFDIRLSTVESQSPAISTTTFASCSSVSEFSPVPTPVTALVEYSMTVTGLSPGATYYFAMKTGDEVPNWSGLSNGATTWAQVDNIAPEAITTLSALTGTYSGEIELSWTSPGDDGWNNNFDSGSTFDIRLSTVESQSPAISTTTFASASSVSEFSPIPTPVTALWPYSMTITGLTEGVTYYFAIRTRDEIPNWSGLSNGTTTWACRVAPAAITDLTGQCYSDTGEVTLYWSTPGDDGWNNTLPEGSKYIIDYSSYSIQWSTATFDVEISTSGVAPYTQVSHTITGLTGETTWYFQIWTRDEIPTNWSGLSNGATVWVSPVLSVSISTDTYNFGEFYTSTISVSGTNITVINDGNVKQTYSIKCSSFTTHWLLKNAPGNDEFTLQAAFHPSQPDNNDIDWEDDDILTESLQQCTTAAFSINGDQHGKDVSPFESNIRNFWFRLKTPLSTSTTTQQNITVTISAEQGSP